MLGRHDYDGGFGGFPPDDDLHQTEPCWEPFVHGHEPYVDPAEGEPWQFDQGSDAGMNDAGPGEPRRESSERGSKTAGGKPPLPLVFAEDIEPVLNSGTFVAGLLGAGTLGCIYGPSNSGKTFIAVDLALRVACGMEWRDRAVDRGVVVYVAGEGGHGIKNRVSAWMRHHSVAGADLDFVLIPSPVNLLDPAADVQRLVEAVQTATAARGGVLRMVVIDTLSRAMAGGDENSPEAMTSFIGNCDTVREALGAHVLLVHHTGKDTGRGARGHSSLRAALDTEIELSAPEGGSGMTATVVKQRDLPKGAEFRFSLQTMVLGQDERGDDVTSCIVIHDDDGSRQAGKRHPIGQAAIAFDKLRDAVAAFGKEPPYSEMIPRGVKVVRRDEWRSYVVASTITNSNDPDSKSRAFTRAAKTLQENGFIGVHNDFFWIAE